jgi:EAL domain-containing protein (putative c-di-GMP-specific phosphodiesterase class I)
MGIRQAIATASDPASVMDRVLGEALVLVPSAEGAAVLLCTQSKFLDYAASVGNLAGATGTRVTIADSISGLAIRSGVTQRSEDVRTDPRVNQELVNSLGILSTICVPLRWAAERVGVLLITSSVANAFGSADEASLAGLAPFVSTVIGAAVDLATCTTELFAIRQGADKSTLAQGHLGGQGESTLARSAFVANVVCPGTAFESASRDRIELALAQDGPTMLFQPIVSLSTGTVVEVEALARFAGTPIREPDRWFAEAASVGLGRALELQAIERAISWLPELPRPLCMAVNAGPDTFCSFELIDMLAASAPDRIVVELTEHVGIEDFPALHRACKRLRTIGAEVAIDDTGTGFASLSLVLEVAPEVIKLDRELTANIDLDPVRRALAGALVTFGAEIGAKVVAEGVETAAELDVLADLGIGYGQGFYICRPGALQDLKGFIRSREVCEPVLV